MRKVSSNIFWNTKHYWEMKTIKLFSFLPKANNSVTIGSSFLLLGISAIISSNTVNILRFPPAF